MLRAAISNEVKYDCYMYSDCDKQIIAGIINSSNPVKVEMQLSFILLSSNLPMANC